MRHLQLTIIFSILLLFPSSKVLAVTCLDIFQHNLGGTENTLVPRPKPTDLIESGYEKNWQKRLKIVLLENPSAQQFFERLSQTSESILKSYQTSFGHESPINHIYSARDDRNKLTIFTKEFGKLFSYLKKNEKIPEYILEHLMTIYSSAYIQSKPNEPLKLWAENMRNLIHTWNEQLRLAHHDSVIELLHDPNNFFTLANFLHKSQEANRIPLLWGDGLYHLMMDWGANVSSSKLVYSDQSASDLFAKQVFLIKFFQEKSTDQDTASKVIELMNDPSTLISLMATQFLRNAGLKPNMIKNDLIRLLTSENSNKVKVAIYILGSIKDEAIDPHLQSLLADKILDSDIYIGVESLGVLKSSPSLTETTISRIRDYINTQKPPEFIVREGAQILNKHNALDKKTLVSILHNLTHYSDYTRRVLVKIAKGSRYFEDRDLRDLLTEQ